MMKKRNWLSALLGLARRNAVADVEKESSPAHEHILKLRCYADGRWTLNGDTVKLTDLKEPAKDAASNGGAVWVWSEGDMSDAHVAVMQKLLDGVNLTIAIGTDENFAGMPLPEQGDDARPSNAMLFNSAKEQHQFVGNETEFYVYLGSLQLLFDVYRADRVDADNEDAGIFHIVGAVRPNASKFWLLHPGVHDDEYYQPLVDSLNNQPLPTVKEGVVAFIISITRPLEPGENPQFEIVIPDEWKDVTIRTGKDMSAPEILDVIWPAEPRL